MLRGQARPSERTAWPIVHVPITTRSAQCSKRTEIKIQLRRVEPVTFCEFLDGGFESHERRPQPLDLLGSQRLLPNPPNCLTLEQLPNELDQCQHEPNH